MTAVIQTSNNSSQADSATTTHTVNLPSGISAGDLLIVFFGMAAPDGKVVTWPAGWIADSSFVRVDQEAGADAGISAGFLKATGSEGATITITTDLGTRSGHVSLRIDGNEDPDTQAPEATTAIGTNSDSNSPTLSPTGGAKDYLWLSVSGRTHDGVATITAPASYTMVNEGASGTGAAHVLVSVAQRSLNAATEDPAAYTGGDVTAEWCAITIAVHPSGGAPPAATHPGWNQSKGGWW